MSEHRHVSRTVPVAEFRVSRMATWQSFVGIPRATKTAASSSPRDLSGKARNRKHLAFARCVCGLGSEGWAEPPRGSVAVCQRLLSRSPPFRTSNLSDRGPSRIKFTPQPKEVTFSTRNPAGWGWPVDYDPFSEATESDETRPDPHTHLTFPLKNLNINRLQVPNCTWK